MQSIGKLWILVLILGGIFFFAPTQQVIAETDSPLDIILVGSDLSSDATWISSNIYVVNQDLIVNAGVTLTIEAGTIVKFMDNTMEIFVDGILNANGTSGSRVYFTSYNDDIGGDTNGDDTPADAGQWGSVYFRDGGSGTLNYVEMRYGGFYDSMLYMDGGTSVAIDHGVFKDSEECAISTDPGNDPTLTNMSPTDFTGSMYNGICMRTGQTGNDATWDETEVAYVLLDDITVTSGFTLTLGPDVVVKPRNYTVEMFVDGTLNANGTSESRVYFTSLNDDSVGGMTNNNANASDAGQWGRVYFRVGGSGTLNYVEMRYGGFYDSMLYMEGGTSVVIDHGLFKDSEECAISTDPGNDPTLANMSPTDFTGSMYNGICMRSGQTSNDATWDETEAAYVLLDDITVTSGFTLTLGPGVVVKPRNYTVEMFVDGTLNANGTSDSRVYFTSLNDDSVGGLTNNNANASEAGQWGRVYFRVGGSGALNYVEMRYGGHYDSLLYMDGGTSVLIDHGLFKDSEECAISTDPGNDPTLTNMSPTDFTGSMYNGICMRAGQTSNDATWDETEVAYVLLDDITVTSGFTLTLGPDVVVKPRNYTVELFVDGTLNANGTSDSRVYFTSLNDDSVGGMTNNTANEAEAGQWGRVYYRLGSNGNLDFVEMRYGGSAGSDWAAIHVNESSPQVTNCVLRDNVRGLSSAGTNAQPKINYCSIYDNSEYGVYNAQIGNWIDATNNWWGSSSGPYDPSPPGTDGSYNYGTGDQVSDYVRYDPWLTLYNYEVFLPLAGK
jgi:hypothetical protein